MPHLGERVHQAGRAALLRLGGPGHRAGFLEPLERRVQRVVVQDDAGRLLHALAQLISVGRPGPQTPEDQDLNVRHIVQYYLCQTGRLDGMDRTGETVVSRGALAGPEVG